MVESILSAREIISARENIFHVEFLGALVTGLGPNISHLLKCSSANKIGLYLDLA